MGFVYQIDYFLIKFTGEILQSCLKTHLLITEANFCAFCAQGWVFKLLINKNIFKSCYS